VFEYGMEHKPFSDEPALSLIGWVMWLNPNGIDAMSKSRYGNKIRHGILVVEKKLPEDFIQRHQLNPIDRSTSSLRPRRRMAV